MSRLHDHEDRTESGRPAKSGSAASTGDGLLPTFDVAALLSARGEAILIHGGERYRLRITSRGKLILTK